VKFAAAVPRITGCSCQLLAHCGAHCDNATAMGLVASLLTECQYVTPQTRVTALLPVEEVFTVLQCKAANLHLQETPFANECSAVWCHILAMAWYGKVYTFERNAPTQHSQYQQPCIHEKADLRPHTRCQAAAVCVRAELSGWCMYATLKQPPQPR
jgi:hypothetical protein